jgi:hypothetical protein
MEKMLRPTGSQLVGAIFICLLISLSASAADHLYNLPDLRKELKDAQFGNFNQDHRGLVPVSLPSEEKVALDESNSRKRVSDMKAMNAVKERDIIFSGRQDGDSKAMEFVNSLDVSVIGPERMEKVWPGERREDNDIEKIVDNALNGSMDFERDGKIALKSPKSQQFGNNLNIDVSGISVSAVNTVKGGSAVATSNIIIKPVQVIICPSEVEEKLI